MALPIPQKIQSEILRFYQLPRDSRKSFGQALRKAPFAIHSQALAINIEKSLKTKGIKIKNVHGLVSALTNLFSVREVVNVSSSELINDVFDSIAKNSTNLKLDPKEIDKVKEELVRLLSYKKPLEISSKANEVLQQHQHVFRSARILTDVRPIFGESDNPKPLATVLVHTLKITYSSGDSISEFFVALDSRDLDYLGGLVTRAKNKETALIPLINKTGMKYLKIQ